MIEHSGVHVQATYANGRQRNIYILPSPTGEDPHRVASEVVTSLMRARFQDGSPLVSVTSKAMTAWEPQANGIAEPAVGEAV
jgi:hypothetical protein